MLCYCGGTVTAGYSATITVSGTSTNTTALCRCPNCGYLHDSYSAVVYSDFVLEKEEPLPLPMPAPPPKPCSDILPPAFIIARANRQPRYGRAMGHRGSFRNFHKLGG